MTSIRPICLPATSLFACLLLAACSGSPSESDIRQAAAQQLSAQQKAQTTALGPSPFLDQQFAQQNKAFNSLKLIDCKSDGEKAYNCDVEISGKAFPMRVVKGASGWLIASNP